MFDKIKKSKQAQEILFWVSAAVIVAFFLVATLARSKLFLIGAGVGFVGIVWYFFLNKEIFFIDKSNRQVVMLTVRILAVLIVAILLFVALNGKLPKTDITATKMYTISSQSKALLKKLDADLEIKLFIDDQGKNDVAMQYIMKLLDSYKKSSKFVKFEMINPDTQVELTKKYKDKYFQDKIFDKNAILLIYKEKYKSLSPATDFYEFQQQGQQGGNQSTTMFTGEKILSSSITFLISAEGKVIYFLLGHKEKYISDYNDDGYSTLRGHLENLNRKVDNLTLIEKGKIPEDCSLLVIAAPQMDYTKDELKIVDDYIAKGGKFILIDDADMKSNVYDHFYKKYKIVREQGSVLDMDNMYTINNQPTPYCPILDLGYHTVTQSIQANNLPVIPFNSASLSFDDKTPPTDLVVTPIITTKNTAWNDIAPAKNELPKFDAKTEKKGIKDIAFVIEKKTTVKGSDGKDTEKLIPEGMVFSNAMLFSNALLGYPDGNLKLAENSMNWLLGDITLLDIPGKEIGDDRMTLDVKKTGIMRTVSWLVIPLLGLLVLLFLKFIRKANARKEITP